jgi:hypothetical protein
MKVPFINSEALQMIGRDQVSKVGKKKGHLLKGVWKSA